MTLLVFDNSKFQEFLLNTLQSRNVTVKSAGTAGRSNNKMLLSTLNFRTLPTLGDRAFAAAAPKLWNTIPLSIRQEQNLEHFKKKLKAFIFM